MIIIYKEIIKKYINYLTPNDIKMYAQKNNIEVNNQEVQIIYNYIKKYYLEILNNNESCFLKLKKEIRPDLYNIIMKLYQENKQKYL